MTPQELKNSILQLAIQGKLVEQRPEEGTAAELVEKILAAKNAKGAKGNLTRSRGARGEKATSAHSASPREAIPDDEKPFDIPESWEWVRLGDAFDIEMGQSPDGASVSEAAGGLEFHQGKIFFGEKYLKQSPQRTTAPTKIAEPNSVLLCVRAPVGKVNITNRRICIGRGLCSILPLAGMDVDFIYYLLAAFETTFVRHATGTTFVAITGKVVKMFPFPLPPLAEQKRIVAKIEELLPLIDRYEKAWSKLEDFNKRFPVDMQKSLLQMAIQGKLVDHRPEEGSGEELLERIFAAKNAKDTKGTKKNSRAETPRRRGKSEAASPREDIPDDEKPFDIPESWAWVRLGEVGSWGSGATPSRTHAEYFGGSIPWLKTGDLNDGYVSSIPETITDLALEKTSVRLNPVGSVLMAMYGATIGKLGILQIAATTNQACCACIPYDGVWNKYLFYYLMARRKAFIKMGEGGAQPNISKEKIVNALIPLPPLAEQKRIVAKLEELLPLCERLK